MPEEGAKLPFEQIVHTSVPPVETVPAAQIKGAVLVDGHVYPVGHRVHAVAPLNAQDPEAHGTGVPVVDGQA
jgi:hypothetical protein